MRPGIPRVRPPRHGGFWTPLRGCIMFLTFYLCPDILKGGITMKLEQALERIVELEAQLKEGSERYNALDAIKLELENSIKEKDESIASLKESNMKFFTMLTTQEESTEQAQEVEETQQEPMDWDDFMSDF